MKKIRPKYLDTYNGGKIIVDSDDYPLLKSIGDRFGWHVDRDGYPVCNYKKHGKTKTIKLHRLIMRIHGYKIKRLHVDHKDRDKLNNQKENLRMAGRRYNNRNRSIVVNY